MAIQHKYVENTPYQEAQRYLENARETYKKAGKDGAVYTDTKYVKGAANYAYHAVLIALDEWLTRKGATKPKRKSIDWYREETGKRDKKLLTKLVNAYNILHLSAGYDGTTSVAVNQEGVKLAEEITALIAD